MDERQFSHHLAYWRELLRHQWPAAVLLVVLVLVLVFHGGSGSTDQQKQTEAAKKDRDPWITTNGSPPTRRQMERAGWIEKRD